MSSRAPPVGIERYGKLDVSDELDDDDDENIDLVKIGSSGDDEDDSEDGDIELRIRPRSNSDVVVVQTARQGASMVSSGVDNQGREQLAAYLSSRSELLTLSISAILTMPSAV